MRSVGIILSVLVMCIAGGAHGASITVGTSGHLAIRPEADAEPTMFLLSFDLSTIPAAASIDLAELWLKCDISSEVGRRASVAAYPVTMDWTASESPSVLLVAFVDSLMGHCFVEPGDESEARFLVTSIAQAWHSGALGNRGLVVAIVDNEYAGFSLVNERGAWQAELRIDYTPNDGGR